MGTRGVVGFRLNGEDKLIYNQYDSYPSGLGVAVAEQVAELREMDNLSARVESLKPVSSNEPASDELFEATKGYHNFGVSMQSEKDPYCLFRDAQGDLKAILDIGYFLEYNDFILDSLFCEWGYIVNLDTGMLEVWKGYQKKPDTSNRYGTEPNEDGYFPCKLVAEFDLETVTPNDVKNI